MKRSSFIKGMEKELCRTYGSQKAKEVVTRAEIFYNGLLHENKEEAKELQRHTKERIYPAISMFKALTEAGGGREKAADFMRAYYLKRCEKPARWIRRILKVPGLYKKIPKFFAKMTNKFFGESMGFQSNFITLSRNEIKFDMTVCPYFEICKKYSCPEIVPMFCEADVVCYGDMHPKVQWLRTKTLGEGGDVCDFHIKIKK